MSMMNKFFLTAVKKFFPKSQPGASTEAFKKPKHCQCVSTHYLNGPLPLVRQVNLRRQLIILKVCQLRKTNHL